VLADIQEMLGQGRLEDAFDALAAQRDAIEAESPDALAKLEEALYDAAMARKSKKWSDPARGSRVLRACLDIAYALDRVDGDTPTALLMRALELTPASDEILLEYVRSVADTDYFCTHKSLGELAHEVKPRALAQKLAAANTVTEYFCVRHYLLPPPQQVYVDALKTAFAEAVALGVDEPAWQSMRAWIEAKIPFAKAPSELFAQYAPA